MPCWGFWLALAAIAFVRVLYFGEDMFDNVRLWPPLKAFAGGGLIGVIALWFPQIYGVGYEAIGEALHGGMVWHLLLILVIVKIVAVSITIGSGGSGGIFAPSLFIGAMLGGAMGDGCQPCLAGRDRRSGGLCSGRDGRGSLALPRTRRSRPS